MTPSLRRFRFLFALTVVSLAAANASAFDGHYHSYRIAQSHPWHGSYQHTAWGSPVALVVPPTVGIQTDYGWGVGNNRITRIHSQFGRRYPGVEGAQYPFQSTPNWPQDTTQFGVYYARGPW